MKKATVIMIIDGEVSVFKGDITKCEIRNDVKEVMDMETGKTFAELTGKGRLILKMNYGSIED